LTALAATGLVAFAAARRRGRVAVVLPAALGAAVALPLLPGSLAADSFVTDQGAIAPVCTTDAPKVCVTRVHAAALDDLRGPARQALAILAAKLPNPPTSVVEAHGDPSATAQPQRADTVPILLGGLVRDATSGRLVHGNWPSDPSQAILWTVLDGAGTGFCFPPSPSAWEPSELDRRISARVVAAGWLLGKLPPAPDQATLDSLPPEDRIREQATSALTVRTLAALRRLRAGEQRARVAALRQAELACDGRDLIDILTGPGGNR
jgi:hypothetical protein